MAEQSIENNDIGNSESNELINLEVGQILKGHVSYIGMDYALVLVDKYEFILPKEEITWTKNTRIKDYIKLDEDIEVVVVIVEEDRAMVSLKRRYPNPWINIEQKYSKGQLTKGKVVNIKDFGVFVELEHDVRGLVNKSEMSLDGLQEVKTLVSLNDIVDVQVKSVNKAECKMSLTRKPFLKTPWETFIENHYVGEITNAVVEKTGRENLHVLIDGVPSVIAKDKTGLDDGQILSVHFQKLDIVKVIINKIDLSSDSVEVSIAN